MRRGFTLVELAIVIVVIGLVAGAILVARSMLDTVRVQSTIRQTAQFDVAITDFKTKYQYMPGDAPSFQFQDGSGPGNGNGMIEDANAAATPGIGRAWSGEVANFWAQLNQSGLKSEAPYSASIPPGGRLSVDGMANPNMPSVKMGVEGTGIFFTNDNGALSNYNISNVYIIGKVSDNDGSDLSFPNTIPPAPLAPVGAMFIKDALTASDLAALDTKLDDGKPQSGNIIAFSEALPGASASCLTGATPAAYNISHGGAACSAAIKYPSVDMSDVPAAAAPTCNGGVTPTPDPGCNPTYGTWDQCAATCDCSVNGGTWNPVNKNCGGGALPNCGCGPGAACYDDVPTNCSGWDNWDHCGNTCHCPGDGGVDVWNPDMQTCDIPDTCPDNSPLDWSGATNCNAFVGGGWNPCTSTCNCPSPTNWTGSTCQCPGDGGADVWNPDTQTCDIPTTCPGGLPLDWSGQANCNAIVSGGWNPCASTCNCPSPTNWNGSTCN